MSKPRRKDLVGNKYGKLTVIGFSNVDAKGHTYWICKCECGGETIARSSHLLSGNVSTCGCGKSHKRTHGDTGKRLYTIWSNMKSRCYNKNSSEYFRYGGRGISICEEWLDYGVFKDWAINNGYSDELSIDRINNDGNYEPKNCKWSTAKEQANNTSRNRNVCVNGETHSVTEWARILGINQSTLSMRMNKYGWSEERAIKTEVKRYGT